MQFSLSRVSLFTFSLLAGCSTEMTGGSDQTMPDLSMPAPDLITCTAAQKLCTDQCLPADTAHGCGGASCTACAGGSNGVATCSSAGACALACNVGFGDCDSNPANGCEKDVNTDINNCGSCGFTCGTTCVNGACQLVTPGMGSDRSCLTIDAGTIYWGTANTTPGAVYSVPKAGGTVKQIAIGLAGPRGVAVDSANIYITTYNGGDILKCPLSGCPATPTKLAMGQTQPYNIVLDGTNLYWTNIGGGQVMKCALAGCGTNPTALATGQSMPSDIAVDASFVYWTNAGNGTVMKVPIGGGALTQVATSGQAGARGLFVDAVNLYYTQAALGTITQVPLAGGAPTTLVTGQMNPFSLASAGGELIWSNSKAAAAGGSIAKIALTGGPVITRAVMQANPLCVAADASTIYWINTAGNSVQKVAR